MKIYTYYEDINFTKQKRLIELWKASWEYHGFTPIVLTRKNATQHAYYNEYICGLNAVNQKLYGKDMDKYCISCFMRWLAYTSISDESMLVSDYDVINGGVDASEFSKYTKERVNLLQGACPSLVIGTPRQFFELCYMFINMSLSNIDEIKKRSSWMNLTFFHDQHFFTFLKDKLSINFSNNMELMHGTEHATSSNRKNRLVHFSHRYTKMRNSIPLTPSNDVTMQDLECMRVDLVEEFLKSLTIV